MYDIELQQNMEMPCRCDCGQWFDLNDGYPSKMQKVSFGQKVICTECYRKEEKQTDFQNELYDFWANEDFRQLSWNQPFTSLMRHGKIETRNRSTNVRGKVLICSCIKRYDPGTITSISGPRQYERMQQALKDDSTVGLLGKAIAVGDLVDCRPMTKEDENACFVEYRTGLWCWIFKNVQDIEPIDVKGKQGWKMVSQELMESLVLI